MWDLDNATDYAAEWNWVRDKQGVHSWLVAVRATFDIRPGGELVRADVQPPPSREPAFRGEPGSSSLLLDSDLLAQKPQTDVVLDAIAYAPGGVPAPVVEVSIEVGAIRKSLWVFGRRFYYWAVSGLALTDPEPFVAEAIVYEHAYGGNDLSDHRAARPRFDSRNPVGRGVTSDIRTLHGQIAHSIEYPRAAPEVWPACLAPIPSFWSPRLERGGTYDSAWEERKRPLLPDDYDPRAACSAPDDQRASVPLRGGERVVLRNLTADGVLAFALPRRTIVFRTHFADRTVSHEGTLSTVFVVPHERRVSLVWQTALPVPALETEYLDFTYIAEDA